MSSKTDDGSMVNLCSTCTKSCCTVVGGAIVLPHELEQLDSIQVNNNKFLTKSNIHGREIIQIKKKDNSTHCIFFDESHGCKIYPDRPFDCKMFPFDLEVINGELYWIIYSCNPQSSWTWTEDFLQKLENDPTIKENKNLENYAIMPNKKTEELPHTVLRKVRF